MAGGHAHERDVHREAALSETCCEFHVGDVGARIGLHFVTCDGRYDVDLDVSDATLSFIFKAADGELTVIRDGDNGSIVAADFGGALGTKVDGKVMYVTEAGFFTVTGPMEVQGLAEFDSGARRHYTSISRFSVGRSLIPDAEVVGHENGSLLGMEDGT